MSMLRAAAKQIQLASSVRDRCYDVTYVTIECVVYLNTFFKKVFYLSSFMINCDCLDLQTLNLRWVVQLKQDQDR